MRWLENLIRPTETGYAHCDLFCGVYDPAQARIEAESVLKACEKYAGSDDPVFRDRCIIVKEERAEVVKHHLSVLWTDFFKPHHLEQVPELHSLFWNAIKAAGDAKKSMEVSQAQALTKLVDEVSNVFWQTAETIGVGLYAP